VRGEALEKGSPGDGMSSALAIKKSHGMRRPTPVRVKKNRRSIRSLWLIGGRVEQGVKGFPGQTFTGGTKKGRPGEVFWSGR